MTVAMKPRDPEDNRERKPIHVRPATGVGPIIPSAVAAAGASDVATTNLVAVMHELNNLLDGATRTLALARRNLGELAMAPGLDPAIEKRLNTTNTALEQMAALLHHAMRPGASSLTASRPATSLIDAITHAIEVHRPLAMMNRIELQAEISPRLVLAPAGPIYPAIANAIRNAIDSISESRLGSVVEVIAELQTRQGEPAEVQIDIIDDGAGLDRRAERHAFDPGFTTKADGFGIGLSLARQIIRSIDGAISIHRRSSQDSVRPGGRGTRVLIRYPLPS